MSKVLISYSFIILGLLTFNSNIYATLITSEVPLGTCAGVNLDTKSGPGKVSEERKKLELVCEVHDNKEAECKKQEKCKWTPKPMVCEAKDESSEDRAEFCQKIFAQTDCEKESFCHWGYPAPACNALDQNNKEDLEICEGLDGTDQKTCEKNSKCEWE